MQCVGDGNFWEQSGLWTPLQTAEFLDHIEVYALTAITAVTAEI